MVFKSKSREVVIQELLDHFGEDAFPKLMEVLTRHLDGQAEYHQQRWDKADASFTEAFMLHEEDRLSGINRGRCAHFRQHPQGQVWNWTCDAGELGCWVLPPPWSILQPGRLLSPRTAPRPREGYKRHSCATRPYGLLPVRDASSGACEPDRPNHHPIAAGLGPQFRAGPTLIINSYLPAGGSSGDAWCHLMPF